MQSTTGQRPIGIVTHRPSRRCIGSIRRVSSRVSNLARIIDVAVCGRPLRGGAPFQLTFLSRRQDYLISHVVL